MRETDGKVVVVTGGSSGIGAGIARAFGIAGAQIVITFRTDRQGAEDTVAAVHEAGGTARAIQADVSRPPDVRRLFDDIGHVDVLVNNAAVYSFQDFEDVDVEEFHRQYDTNVLGSMLTIQAFMRQTGDTGGSIINIITSGLASNQPGAALYLSTKAAVATLTKVLANELGPRAIRVNAIAAGATETAGSRRFFTDDAFAAVAAGTPLGRVGQPEDIAPVAVFLASDEARWITGDIIYASGGLR